MTMPMLLYFCNSDDGCSRRLIGSYYIEIGQRFISLPLKRNDMNLENNTGFSY